MWGASVWARYLGQNHEMRVLLANDGCLPQAVGDEGNFAELVSREQFSDDFERWVLDRQKLLICHFTVVVVLLGRVKQEGQGSLRSGHPNFEQLLFERHLLECASVLIQRIEEHLPDIRIAIYE